MAGLAVVWTRTALRQRNLIFEYWNDRNKSKNYSKRLLSEINQRILHISLFPTIGKKVDFKNTRAVSLGHYSIFYKEVDNQIIITAFWDNRDDPDKLLRLLQ